MILLIQLSLQDCAISATATTTAKMEWSVSSTTIVLLAYLNSCRVKPSCVSATTTMGMWRTYCMIFAVQVGFKIINFRNCQNWYRYLIFSKSGNSGQHCSILLFYADAFRFEHETGLLEVFTSGSQKKSWRSRRMV